MTSNVDDMKRMAKLQFAMLAETMAKIAASSDADNATAKMSVWIDGFDVTAAVAVNRADGDA